MSSVTINHEIEKDLPPGVFAWIEEQVNSNQKALKEMEDALLVCARRCSRLASWGRGLAILFAALIPITQVDNSLSKSLHLNMPIVAAVLGGLAAIVGGFQSHFKFEAKAQGARVLAALAEAKRESVMIMAFNVRMIKCPRVRFGEAMGLLTSQQTCMDHVRSKATDLDLSLFPDTREMIVDLDQDFARSGDAKQRRLEDSFAESAGLQRAIVTLGGHAVEREEVSAV